MSSTINDFIESEFNRIENSLFFSDNVNKYRGLFEVKKVYVKKENEDIKCDLDIRLKHWPEGVYVKVYKHKALGVFAYVKDEALCQSYLKEQAIACKFWRNAYYFSHFKNLDEDRYVLREGNNMNQDDTQTCLNKILAHLDEVCEIINK